MIRFSRENLETLAAVVDEGTFDAAARRLHVTPSAVSQRLKALEQEAGRVLLVRTKPIRPTPSGEVLLRLARQQSQLERDAAAALGLGGVTQPVIPIAVNADSLAAWILPPLARAAIEHGVTLDLRRDDQSHTLALLADGTVMAAVTSEARTIPGCTSTLLGRVVYRPVAAPAFVARWLPEGPTPESFAVAPIVQYDRKDDLQSRYLRQVTRKRLTPPRHFVPGAAEFARAIELGLGWGMLPDAQADGPRAAGTLVDVEPRRRDGIDVPLYWQQWDLRSPVLDAVAAAVRTEARRIL